MTIVVFGATGDQGQAQVRALSRLGRAARAVSRKGNGLDLPHIENVAGDFADAASLDRVLKGAKQVMLNVPSTSLVPPAPVVAAVDAVAKAAKRAGVEIIVFNTSLPVPEKKLGFAAQDAKVDMRDILFASGVPSISIEPVVFLDNMLKSWTWPGIAKEGKLVYPHRETLDVSWICHDDIASLMISAMDRPHFAGRRFPVGGPDIVRGPVLAQKLSRAWNMPIRFVSRSVEDFVADVRKVFRDATPEEADRLAYELDRIYRWYNESPDHPFCVEMGPVLKELPAELTPIETWAKRQVLPKV
jgi:uncharacterized protein YbjT (DUF2867 family)